MLARLTISNYALIDALDISFPKHLVIITGQTGAGKSILLDSLGLLLGNRAEVGLIRQGEEKLSVVGTFTLPKNQEFEDFLKEYDLEADDEIVIKRTLSIDGKGKIFFNDQPVSSKILKDIGHFLVEVHGQFDNQGLLNPANHLDILDAYGCYPEKISAVAQAYRLFKQTQKERSDAEKNIASIFTNCI